MKKKSNMLISRIFFFFELGGGGECGKLYIITCNLKKSQQNCSQREKATKQLNGILKRVKMGVKKKIATDYKLRGRQVKRNLP